MSVIIPKNTRAPKRVIQRRFTKLVETGINNVEGLDTIHTTGDPETLTRLRITGFVVPDGVGTIPKLHFAVSIWRNGNRVIDPLTSSAVADVVEPLELLVRDSWGGVLNTDVGVMNGIRVEIDTKIQRKLKAGDLIKTHMITNGSTSTFDAVLDITQWYKQN